jgi:hypothetical protein
MCWVMAGGGTGGVPGVTRAMGGVRAEVSGCVAVSAPFALFFGNFYSKKNAQEGFAEIERTLAKRKNAREASKSSRNTIESRDDVAIVNYIFKSDRDVIVIVLSQSNSRHHDQQPSVPNERRQAS